MGSNDRNDRNNDQRSNRGNERRSDAPKVEPWNLSIIVSETRQDGTTREHFEQIGTIWPMKEREGFTWTQHVTVPAGSRMAAMPRKRNGGDR